MVCCSSLKFANWHDPNVMKTQTKRAYTIASSKLQVTQFAKENGYGAAAKHFGSTPTEKTMWLAKTKETLAGYKIKIQHLH